MIPQTTNSLEQRNFYCSVPPPPKPPPLTQLARPQHTEQKTSNTQYTHSILLKSTSITKIMQLCFTVQFVIDVCSLQEDMSA